LHVRAANKDEKSHSQSAQLMSNPCCKCLGASEAPEPPRKDAPPPNQTTVPPPATSAAKPASAPAAQPQVAAKPHPALTPLPLHVLQAPAVQNHMMMQLRATEPNTPPPFDRKDYKYSNADSPDSSPPQKTPAQRTPKAALFSPAVPPRSAPSARPNHHLRAQYKTVTGDFYFFLLFTSVGVLPALLST
jgi:hypothetical protein